MKILGIETATALCATALIDGTDVLCDQAELAPQVHAERLLAIIDLALKANNVPQTELGAIAISIGPGSYTGLRIGLSVAKGLAFATDTPIVAVPTLQAIALHAMRQAEAGSRTIVALLESRKDEVFVACYTADPALPVETRVAMAMSTAEACALIRSLGPSLIAGPGATRITPLVADELSSGSVTVLPAGTSACSATAVALLGAQLYSRNGAADTASLEPFYLKEFFTTAKPVQTTE